MRIAVCLLAGGLAAGALFGPTPPAPAAEQAAPAPASTAGGLGCAAASCHGGGRAGERFSEHSTWAADLTRVPPVPHDPHANAYRVLFNADSVRIAKLLGGGPAHTNATCLKCHSVPGAEAGAVAEGVGCAGCHGPEEKWLTVHYFPEWKALSNREKAASGFVPTKNIVARASACVGCHVGDATRDVDHDLIAAGHPRLNFEMARFQNSPMYRKHWTDPAADTGFEVKTWAVGQVASLRAAADLLRARADRAGPWPEFAGQSCYACHQSVGDRDPRAASPARGLGWPAWEAWYTAAAGPAFDLTPGYRAGIEKELTALQAVMNRPNPPRAAAKEKAAALVAALDRWLTAAQDAEDAGRLVVPTGTARRVAEELARASASAADWDSLAQQYLGCAAVYHSAGGRPANPTWEAPLVQIRDGLRFPPATSGRWDSPRGFDATRLTQVRANFGRLLGGDR
ncbi:MAG: multiheme c-type cytochrome [Gemmataceae bacterium]